MFKAYKLTKRLIKCLITIGLYFLHIYLSTFYVLEVIKIVSGNCLIEDIKICFNYSKQNYEKIMLYNLCQSLVVQLSILICCTSL